jgi:chaperone modulatory protein CbpM
MRTREFLLSARLDAAALDAWVAAGWLAPSPRRLIAGSGLEADAEFSETDVARAWLIHDLHRMGINDEGIAVILDLIDQLHGLRRALRASIAMVPEAGMDESSAGYGPEGAPSPTIDQDADRSRQ